MLCCIVHAIDCNRFVCARTDERGRETEQKIGICTKITILTYKEWSYFWTLDGTTAKKHAYNDVCSAIRVFVVVVVASSTQNRITYFHIFDNEMFMFYLTRLFFVSNFCECASALSQRHTYTLDVCRAKWAKKAHIEQYVCDVAKTRQNEMIKRAWLSLDRTTKKEELKKNPKQPNHS